MTATIGSFRMAITCCSTMINCMGWKLHGITRDSLDKATNEALESHSIPIPKRMGYQLAVDGENIGRLEIQF